MSAGSEDKLSRRAASTLGFFGLVWFGFGFLRQAIDDARAVRQSIDRTGGALYKLPGDILKGHPCAITVTQNTQQQRCRDCS